MTMQKQILAAGFFLLSFMLPLKATAATLFSGLYIFGDSISDTGNVFNVSTALNASNPNIPIIPPSPFYSNGRFSNGPVWVDYLAQDLGLSLTPYTDPTLGTQPIQGINFAFSGATTGTDNTIFPSLPGLQQQIGFFDNLIPASQTADKNALYIVLAGANDYLPTQSSFKPYTEPDKTIENITSAVRSLAALEAKNIMVVNLPDLGKLPLTSGTPDANRLNALTKKHNSSLFKTLDNLSDDLAPDVNLISLDFNSAFNDAIANPAKYNFTNVTDRCLFNPQCTNPNEYLFWDQIHPSTATHKILGQLAYSRLTAPTEPGKSVPEPASALGILAFGALGAGSVFKGKQKKVRVGATEV